MLHLLFLLTIILNVLTASEAMQRLPGNIQPMLYKIKFTFNTDDSPKYSGYAIIKVNCIKSTRRIVLHGNMEHGLTIHSNDVKVKKLYGSKEEIVISSVSFDKANEFINIDVKEDLLEEKEYLLIIPFSGPVNQEVKGLFTTKLNGRYIIATNFKRTYARTVFPCFDEPAIKAKFQLSIEHNINEKTLSNTPRLDEKESTETPGFWIDTFFDTPKISTNQVSFLLTGSKLHDFFGVEDGYGRIPVGFSIQEQFKGVAQPGSILVGDIFHLLSVAFKLPPITQDVLKKIDYVVVPGEEEIDSATLGLIFKRDNEYFSSSEKNNPAPMMYLMYEDVARQWFGASLSPVWWDSQWLLNSLAKYVPLFLLPDTYFISDTLSKMFTIMDWDSRPGSGKVNDILKTDGTLEQKTSDNQVIKGLMLIRMVHKTIGMAKFILATQDFAKKYTASSISADDFWDEIDRYASYETGRFKWKKTVELIPQSRTKGEIMEYGTKRIMRSWTDQEGYPIVYVERIGTSVKVSQKRFYSDKMSNEAKQNSNQCWWIPLTYTTEANPKLFGNTEPKKWLGCNDQQFPSGDTLKNVVKPNHWIIFNNKLTGLYRVNYDPVSWDRIISGLKNPKKFTEIHPFNRAQLVNDVLVLSWKNEIDFDTAFQLLSYLRYETDLFVWKSFFTSINNFKFVLKQSPILDDFKVFVKGIMTKVYETEFSTQDSVLRYINEDESAVDYSTKMFVHMWSCMFMVPKCVSQSQQIFSKWKKTGDIPVVSTRFPQGLVLSVLCTILRTEEGEQEFQILFDKFQKLEVNAVNRDVYVEVIECSKSTSAIKKILDWSTTTTENEVIDEKILVFGKMLSINYTYKQAIKYFYDNFPKINTFFSQKAPARNPSVIHDLVMTMACEMNTEEMVQLKKFIRGNKILKNTITSEELKYWERVSKLDQQWLDENSKSLKAALLRVKND